MSQQKKKTSVVTCLSTIEGAEEALGAGEVATEDLAAGV